MPLVRLAEYLAIYTDYSIVRCDTTDFCMQSFGDFRSQVRLPFLAIVWINMFCLIMHGAEVSKAGAPLARRI